MDTLELVGSKSLHRPVLSQETALNIQKILPERLQSHTEWKLAYSLERDGAALSTLYSNLKPHAGKPKVLGGYVLAVRDSAGGVFGAYLNEYLHPSDGSVRYYGTGDCFLWRTVSNSEPGSGTQLEAFLYTGLNDFIIFCTPHFVSVGGGGGSYGLWLDDTMEHGVSDRTDTFGNKPLSLEGSRFKVVSVEVWQV